MKFRPNIDIKSKTAYISTLLIPWILLTVCHPTFQTNDDTANILLVDGTFGRSSLDTSIFLSSILSRFLWQLYKAYSAIPWYPILILAYVALAQALLLHMLWRTNFSSRFFHAVFLTAILFFVLSLTLICSFTASALLLSGVAMYYGLFGPGRKRTAPCILSLACLALGFLLRPGVAWIAVLALAPAVLAALKNRTLAWNKMIRYALMASAVLATLFLAEHAIESKETTAFRQNNLARATFSDTSWGDSSDDFGAALKAAGWSQADYYVAKALWFYLDDEVHSIDAITSFIRTNSTSSPLPWNPQRLTAFLSASARSAGLFVAITLLWLALQRWRPESGAWIQILLCMTIIVALAGFRFPQRIAYPFFLLSLLGLAVIGSAPKTYRPVSLPVKALLSVAACGILAWSFTGEFKLYRTVYTNQDVFYQSVAAGMDEILQASPNAFFVPVMYRGYSEANFMLPFNGSRLHRTLPNGWMAQGPLRVPYLQSMGFSVEEPFMPQLLSNRNAVWYCLARTQELQPNIMTPLLDYMNQNYAKDFGREFLAQPIKVKSAGAYTWLFFVITER